MSELDKLKETITQLRLRLGISVVTKIILIGWAASNYGQVPGSVSSVLADDLEV